MKRIPFIIFILALLPVIVLAENVSLDKASLLAGKFLGADASDLVSESKATRASGQNAFYVFNNPNGGWAIIAADDRVTPVLAYSETGSFQMEDMPDNLRYWMDGISEVIDSVRITDLPVSSKIKGLWSAMQSGQAGTGNQIVLNTAKWGQYEPFNNLCPVTVNDAKRAATGCVATAMAIVMRYNKWPELGSGTIGGYESNSFYQYFPAYSIDDHHYDWASMPMTYDDTSSDYARNQVATLMLDCGMSIEMDYTFDGSGAIPSNAAQALKDRFSYNSLQYLSRTSFDNGQWLELIKNEIEAKRVVLYGGNGKEGGHSFVCDGFDFDNSMLHVNWGWNGRNDGFFSLDLYIQEKNFGFEKSQHAIIGLTPGGTVPGTITYQPFVAVEQGLVLLGVSVLSRNGLARFRTGVIMNYSSEAFILKLRVCLMNSKGEIRQQIGETFQEYIGPNTGFSDFFFDGRLDVQPDMTDYFQLFVYDGQKEEWVPLRYVYNYCPSCQPVCCGITPDPLIMIPDDCHQSDVITLELSYGRVPVKDVKWYVNGTEYSGKTLTVTQGRTELKAEVEYCDNSTGTITKTLIVE